jgi:hypothetical protein
MRFGRLGMVAIVWLGLGAVMLPAQEPPERVRGRLAAVEGDRLSVETRAGERVELRLKEDAGIFVVRPAALDDIRTGDFVGVTSIEAGGRRVALEVHLFAEDLRGVGEGHYPWDLVAEPNMMTNATVAEIEAVGEDRVLEMTYAEGQGEGTARAQTVYVPFDAPIVRIEQTGTSDMLTPGRAVFLMVEASESGPVAVATVVGEGIDPPM